VSEGEDQREERGKRGGVLEREGGDACRERRGTVVYTALKKNAFLRGGKGRFRGGGKKTHEDFHKRGESAKGKSLIEPVSIPAK